ncbi:TIGR02147 family protein [Bdellovibrio sp. HCB290]|uniref:TIGR02147 family protein n=1 Tax=Bdellovibrio sp. HCB290 TaxID=3394356 RepID=UPI0039B5C45A
MTSMNYREILKNELEARIANNAQYSLRALAQQTGISNSMLSLIINGKRNLSAKRALDICRALKFNERKTDFFLALVQLATAKSPEVRSKLQEKIFHLAPKSEANKIDTDVFQMISDWYHFPILEMARTSMPPANKEAVVQRLGISSDTAQEALDRLQRLELLTKDESGHFHTCKSQIVSNSDTPSQALRNFHRQMLEKASQSLETQTSQEKFVGSETFAFAADDLKKAREILEECFSKIVRLSASRNEKDHVYHLGIQMFRLTKEIT